MEKTHWLQSPNKNYLGHWDLPNGEDLVLTIKSAEWEEVKNPIINTSELKRVIRFKEDVKPFICNQTNAQSILNSTGIKFMEDSEGQKIQLYVGSTRDHRAKIDVDCIRIRKEVTKKQREVLDEKHKKWETAKEKVKTGEIDFEGLNKYWIVDEKTFLKLQE